MTSEDHAQGRARDIVAGLTASHPDLKLGGYLHGSHHHGSAGPNSDIDVLVVADWTVPRDRTRQLQDSTVAALDDDVARLLDLKVLPAAVLVEDPWVDLHRAGFLGGHAWHEEFPPRTQDQAARESLLVLQGIFADGLDQGLAEGLRKPVGRLSSVVSALLDPEVPQSRREAYIILQRHPESPLAKALLKITDELSSMATSQPIHDQLHGDIERAVAATAQLLQERLNADALGPRCAEAARDALSAYHDSH